MSNIWQDAVYDRSIEDVKRLLALFDKGTYQQLTPEEQAEFSQDSKGAINASDLNRIQNNIGILLEVLEIQNTVTPTPAIPTNNFYTEIINNTAAIRGAGYIRTTTPQTPAAPLNTYTKWNDIEHILFDVYEILCNNLYYYAGSEIYAGDTVGLIF